MCLAQHRLMCRLLRRSADCGTADRRRQEARLENIVVSVAVAHERTVLVGDLVIDLHVKGVAIVDPLRAIEEVVCGCRTGYVRAGMTGDERKNVLPNLRLLAR